MSLGWCLCQTIIRARVHSYAQCIYTSIHSEIFRMDVFCLWSSNGSSEDSDLLISSAGNDTTPHEDIKAIMQRNIIRMSGAVGTLSSCFDQYFFRYRYTGLLQSEKLCANMQRRQVWYRNLLDLYQTPSTIRLFLASSITFSYSMIKQG